MANFTPNFNLNKPLGAEFYNVADQNSNMDIIDSKLKDMSRADGIAITDSVATALGLPSTASVADGFGVVGMLRSDKTNELELFRTVKAKGDILSLYGTTPDFQYSIVRTNNETIGIVDNTLNTNDITTKVVDTFPVSVSYAIKIYGYYVLIYQDNASWKIYKIQNGKFVFVKELVIDFNATSFFYEEKNSNYNIECVYRASATNSIVLHPYDLTDKSSSDIVLTGINYRNLVGGIRINSSENKVVVSGDIVNGSNNTCIVVADKVSGNFADLNISTYTSRFDRGIPTTIYCDDNVAYVQLYRVTGGNAILAINISDINNMSVLSVTFNGIGYFPLKKVDDFFVPYNTENLNSLNAVRLPSCDYVELPTAMANFSFADVSGSGGRNFFSGGALLLSGETVRGVFKKNNTWFSAEFAFQADQISIFGRSMP